MDSLSRLPKNQKAALEREIKAILRPKIEAIVETVRVKHGIPKSRPFTKQDFYAICESEGIHLANTRNFEFMADVKQVQGCLMRFNDGTLAIYLRSFFTGKLSLPIAFHEIGHFFLHRADVVSGATLFRVDRPVSLRKEIEADLFSAIARGR